MILSNLFESYHTCPECGGPAFDSRVLAEKKDACYAKVRSRYKVWPSAYASGALVQCRKKGAANWGNKSQTESEHSDHTWSVQCQGKEYPCHDESHAVNKARKLIGSGGKSAIILRNGKPHYTWALGQKIQTVAEGQEDIEESGLQYYTGVKKHGEKYMKLAAKAGREGASQEELGRLRDRYSKAEKSKNNLKEFSQDGGGDAGDFLLTLARAWYMNDIELLAHIAKTNKSVAQGMISGKVAVEKLLARGVVGPDGKVRKYEIDFTPEFDGVELYTDDYFEHSDYGPDGKMVDGRTGKPWGPYEFISFSDEQLGESVAEAGPFSYGYKPPRKGSVAYWAEKKRKEQEKGKPPIEPKDQMVGVAKVTKGVAEGEGKTQKYEMMMRNGQVKKFVAKDDADAKRIAAGHGAKSVIRLRGGVPAGKVAEQGVAEDISSTKKKISKYEELALAANRAGDDAKCKQYQQKIQVLKQKMSQGVAEGWKEKVGAAAMAGAIATGAGANTPKVPLDQAIRNATAVYNINKAVKKQKEKEAEKQKEKEAEKQKEKEAEKPKSDDKQVKEKMLPKSAFAGSDKNKLGPAAHLKGSMKRPARQGDLVGGMEEDKIKGVAEGLEQVYRVLAVDKSNALSKQVKLKVKASSLDEVFERLAINDWYPLEINGVEVINGKRLKQGVAEGYTGRETKDGTWRVFKDGQAVAVAGPFKSRDEAHAWIKKHKQGVAEGLNEMDKSAPQPGRDGKVSHSTYGSRDKKGSDYFKGKEAPGKPVTAKQMSKDALDILKKQGVTEEVTGHILQWPELVNKFNGAMKSMGWKSRRQSDDAFMFTVRGSDIGDDWHMVIIENQGNNFFTYALGGVEEGDPYIFAQDSLPTTAASLSELMRTVRDGFHLVEQRYSDQKKK